MPSVVVIGAGIGGLATAALLAKQGFDVTVIEKNAQIGGRAACWEEHDFRFDMGPSWYQMPEAFERYFGLFDKTPETFYELLLLDPQYKAFFPRAEPITIYPDLNTNLSTFDTLEPGSAKKLRRFLAHGQKQYELSRDYILYKRFDSWKDFLTPEMARTGMQFDLFGNLQNKVYRTVSDPRLQKILLYTSLFVGGNPKWTPSMFSMMTWLDFGMKTWYPSGGIGEFVMALYRLCKHYGVSFHRKTEVSHLEIRKGKVSHIISEDCTYNPDIVVANADYAHIETELLPASYRSYPLEYWNRKTMAPSALVMYLGVDKRIPNLAHHSLYLDDDWDRFFDDIFILNQWPQKPTFYVSCTSKTDPSSVPYGKANKADNLFATVQLPARTNQEVSDEMVQEYATKIIRTIETMAGSRFSDKIVVKRVFPPQEFATRYNAFKGTAIGLANTLRQSTFMRPAQKSEKVTNLYYTGQYTHPGVGMPMCLISAELIAKRIEEEHSST